MQFNKNRIEAIAKHLSLEQNEVFIVSYARTPLGTLCGNLGSTDASKLGSVAISGSLQKLDRKLEHCDIDEVILGHVLQAGCGQAPARQAALGAGIPAHVPSYSVNKVCASGMKAITNAVMSISFGYNSICVAGGMESMSRTPHMLKALRSGKKMGHDQLVDGLIHDGLWDVYNNQHMGSCAEKIARDFGITREEADQFSAESARRALEATATGIFDCEIAPVTVGEGPKATVVKVDEQLSKLNPAKLASLKPSFESGGIVTAGNASPISDGAAAVVLMSREAFTKRNIAPIAKILAWSDGERDPVDFGIAPSISIQRALEIAGLSASDIDLWEINEAFAAIVLANMKLIGNIPRERVNVLGGAVSLGHPLGCSGARIVCTLLTALRQKGLRIGCAAICNGGGGSTAIIVRMVE